MLRRNPIEWAVCFLGFVFSEVFRSWRCSGNGPIARLGYSALLLGVIVPTTELRAQAPLQLSSVQTVSSSDRVTSLIQSQRQRFANRDISSADVKKDLVARSLQRLNQAFSGTLAKDDRYRGQINQLATKSNTAEQITLLEGLRENLRREPAETNEKNQRYDAVCKHLALLQWEDPTWNASVAHKQLDSLEAAYKKFNLGVDATSWNEFAHEVNSLLADPALSDFAEEVTRSFSRPNIVLSAPRYPLKNQKNKTKTQPFDQNFNEGQVRLHAVGTATVNFDVHFQDMAGQANVVVDVQGVSDSTLYVNRKRINLIAKLATTLSGSLSLPLVAIPKETTCLQIDNTLRLCCADFRTNVPILNGLADRLVQSISTKKLPEIEAMSENKLQSSLKTAISKAIADGVKKGQDNLSKYVDKRLEEHGARVKYDSAEVRKSANLRFHLDTNYGIPRLSPYAYQDSELEDQIVVRLGQGLFSQFSDSMRGLKMRETDVRELFFEPIGLVPEFEKELIATPACSIQLSNQCPFDIELHQDLIRLSLRCDGFDTGEKNYEGKFQMSAQYRAQYADGKLKLTRMGAVQIETKNSESLAKLQDISDRFFPFEASTSEISLLDQLTESTDVSISRFEFQDGWLLVYANYDTNALFERLLK